MPSLRLLTLLLVVSPQVSTAQTPEFPREPTIVAPIAVGGLLGLAGVVGGAYLGYEVDKTCDNSSDFCLEPGFFLGAAVAGTFGASMGAHFGNRRRGNAGRVLLFSYLTWAAGVGAAFATGAVNNNLGYAVLFALPAVQLGITVAVERSTGRANERRYRDNASVRAFVAPFRRGVRIGLAFRL